MVSYKYPHAVNVYCFLTSRLSFHVQFTHSAPSSAPAEVTSGIILSTSFVLHWQPPPFDSQNGIIRHYEIVLVELETGTTSNYTTTDTTITISSLHPYYTYEYKVAAVTVATGPFSETVSIQTLSAGKTRI